MLKAYQYLLEWSFHYPIQMLTSARELFHSDTAIGIQAEPKELPVFCGEVASSDPLLSVSHR